ncbi:MAG: putative RNA uridine N3 methyltransferase [Nitrososphaerota archaeon]
MVNKRNVRVDVLIPSSFSAETPHIREKTLRIGMVARYLAAFRIETLIIYPEELENPMYENAEYIKLIMDYLNTAPYLRKKLFPFSRKLRYVGILPPLNIPTHPEEPTINVHHFREGLVVRSDTYSIIEAGLSKQIKISKKLKKRSKVIVEVEPVNGKPRFRVYSRRKAEVYSGFKTTIVLEKLDEIVRSYDLKIATSRLGLDVRSVWKKLEEDLGRCSRVCIVFGASKRGLYEIAKLHGIDLEKTFNYILNTFPNQGVKTIRTEEAIAYTLSILNLITP